MAEQRLMENRMPAHALTKSASRTNAIEEELSVRAKLRIKLADKEITPPCVAFVNKASNYLFICLSEYTQDEERAEPANL